ncbi:hypothetical protein AGOR_G00226330 [Albula goreensis]|uniref:Uncharacterized protein n=1 Tax=Albula goreensis TaxID=1534307 RepID=A0A8T3CKF8_9TELE|nr:hypothetical protein AGOR_G00226330 [Albula goreensis]
MGRLDDAAKRKVVELRRAGLSFRKIKAVLELENIKVSAQAIYLFLKEFQGKPRQEEAGGRTGAGTGNPQAAAVASGDGGDGTGSGRQAGWPDQQVWNLIRDPSRASGYTPLLDSSQQGGAPRSGAGPPGGRPSGGAAAGGGGGRSEQQDGGKEDDIRIVSVTSLARGTQHGGPQMAGAGSLLGASMRRKAPMSPASSSILVARKRLLDKALLHKARMREMSAQAGQQMGQLFGRGQACFQGNDARKVTVLPQTPTLSLTSPRLPQARRTLEGQPVAGLPRRTLQQRPGLPARSQHPPLQREPPSCTAIRPPNPAPAPPAGQGTSTGSTTRSQLPPNPSPRKDTPGASQDSGLRGGLQEQLQTLGAEIRGLGLAVRLLTEQHNRVEREQAQQTQVQRQILSTLQALASALQPAKTPTPTPPGPPGPAQYRQDSHTPTRTTYAQCSQPPLTKYCELDGSGLESLEGYKLAGLSPPSINGFQASSTTDSSLTLGSTQTHTPTYTPAYSEAFPHSYSSPVYSTQSHVPTYGQTYTETHGQASDYPVTVAGNPLEGCSPSTNLPPVNPDSPLPLSPHDPQLNIIKVETL